MTTDPNPTLLPCPFCGSEDVDAHFALSESNGVKTASPGCMDCGAMTETVEGWNKRTPRTDPMYQRLQDAAERMGEASKRGEIPAPDPNHCRSCHKELTPGEKSRQRLDYPLCDKCGARQND